MDDVQAILLYTRAGYANRQELAALGASLAGALPGVVVEPAFEEMAAPSLIEVIDRLAAQGLSRFCVVPCALPSNQSIMHWLPGALSATRARHGERIVIRVAPPVGAFVDLAPAILAAVASPAGTDVATVTPSLGKPGWSKVPEHRRQVFFCLGVRCLHRGAVPLWQHFRRLLKDERRLASAGRRVMCARCSCLFPCNQGPLMVVQPDGVWYGGLDAGRLERIVREHLVGGVPVAEAVIHRLPGDDAPGDDAPGNDTRA